MKSRKKLIWIIVMVVLMITIIAVSLYILYLADLEKNPVKKAVVSCQESYKSVWELSYVKTDDFSKTIDIVFEKSGWKADVSQRNKSIVETYRAIYEELLNSSESAYRDYTVCMGFLNIGDYFDIRNIDKELRSVEIRVAMPGWGLKELSNSFPETKVLISFSAIHYDSIAEIAAFDSLEHIEFGKGSISKKEREMILSIYPDCEIT